MSVKIALAGNPNSGKTTMFNDLTGSNQRVGNWPGVTVEKKEGKLKGRPDVVIQDLPGIYSLSPYTLEEVVARSYLVGEKPDAIINIVDGTNIERNLYLTTQLIELGIPTVVAVNMIDVVRKNGDVIDLKKLGAALGCEVVATSALKGEGSKEAAARAAALAEEKREFSAPSVFEGSVEHAIAHIEEGIEGMVEPRFLRWYAIKLFERDGKVMEELHLDRALAEHIEEHIADCEAELDDDAESIITNQRYAYIAKVVSQAVKKKHTGHKMNVSDRIDRIVTNRILALPIFVAVMAAVYYISIGSVGDWTVGFMNDTLFGEWITGGLTTLFEGWNVAPWLSGLVIEGIVGGVGAVLGFVPQMLILFLLLSILEDIGYMARVAFIMDRIFRKFGLSGKSFIPMLIGSGCGVPGVMASRTIENERDRRMTVMTTCFIPCGAKLPIIGMISGAFFDNAWWVATSAYFVGVAAIVVSGIILKKIKAFAGDAAPFVMELPPYHAPAPSNIFRSTWERGWSFIKRAGTLILLSAVVIWFLQAFGVTSAGFGMVEDNNDSLLAAIGGAVAFIFAPLGFGIWQATVGVVGGLVAKENLVTIMAVCYGFAEVGETGEEIWGILNTTFTPIAGYSFMVFNLLCAPCFAAMGAIKREMNSPKWTVGAIGYMCGFAYLVSLMIYQFGGLITGELNFGLGTVAAIVVLAGLLYMLFRKNRYSEYGGELSVNAAKKDVKVNV
ncbi:MAG: ferrous iron transport protein B [Oscillospiraceae bacterium]|nr:ferrous iron transport protein B [Oscillospiraceae bacterium]